MTPLELFRNAMDMGLRLESDGDRLNVFGTHCPADFAEELRQHKPALLEWLNRPPCPGWQTVPPGDLPMNPARPGMATAAARRVMAFVVRQIRGTCPLCEWCLRRELAYWTEFHWPDEDCAIAAARDAACWQLNRSERDVLELLLGFDECRRK